MHNHDHGHQSHGHHHHHHVVPEKVGKAFMAGIILNGVYVAAQATAGFITHSMALLSDAGHNLSDVATLVLSLVAFRLARVKPTQSFTYGYKKTTILAALINAVVLFMAIGVLGYESVNRLMHPQPLEGGVIAAVAAVGIVINFGSAMLFFRSKEHDLNTRGAYLHLLADGLVSLGVVAAGIAIRFTGWYWLDGAISIVILLVILVSTWSLLTASLRMSMDAVPEDMTIENISKVITGVQGVEDIHHTHIWAMSTTENALTAHVVLNEKLTFGEKMNVVRQIKHELLHNNIHHATIELESADIPCGDDNC